MSGSIQDVYLLTAVRTPVGKAGRSLASVRADDLLIHAIQASLKAIPKLDPACIEDVIIGCAMPEGEQGMNVARIASLLAGLPNSVPAMTINRFCASGLQSVAMAAERIAMGGSDVILAGGVESMTRIPMGGFHFNVNPRCFEQPEHAPIAYGMGLTAECVAEKYGVDRKTQDEFAYNSHQRALAAIRENAFADEIVPITATRFVPDLKSGRVKEKNQEVLVDEGPRADCQLEGLAKLRSVFKAQGTVTAGNSSQMSDGAATLILAGEKFVQRHDLRPLGRFLGFSVQGVPPELMGIGPVAAIPKVLKQVGLSLDDLAWIELNEAFAAQAVAVIKTVGLDPARVNPLGGAIALGHPLGATGSIRLATALHGLRRQKARYGMVTMCIGTGMGAAGVIEAL